MTWNERCRSSICITIYISLDHSEARLEESLEWLSDYLTWHRYIIPTINERKITYFGHMIRRNNIHMLLLEGPLEGKLSRGRPRMEWLTNITECTGMRYEDLVRIAQDRDPWRIMTANLLKEDGT